jgi:hypothetical protein
MRLHNLSNLFLLILASVVPGNPLNLFIAFFILVYLLVILMSEPASRLNIQALLYLQIDCEKC